MNDALEQVVDTNPSTNIRELFSILGESRGGKGAKSGILLIFLLSTDVRNCSSQ